MSKPAPPNALVLALKRALRPLIRLSVAHGLTLPAIIDLLKSLYVDVAERDFPVDGKIQTDSRISLLTGVHRKDVRRLRRLPNRDETPPLSVSVGAQVVGHWLTEAAYLDKQQQPRRLPLRGSTQGEPSFEALVSTVSRRDLRPRVVLDELLRLGVVTVHDNEQVELVREGFLPAKGFDEKAYYLGINLADHADAAAANLDSETPPHLERSVIYHGLTEADVRSLDALVREHGIELLKLINRRANQMQRRALTKPQAQERIALGLYFYHRRVEEQSSDE